MHPRYSDHLEGSASTFAVSGLNLPRRAMIFCTPANHQLGDANEATLDGYFMGHSAAYESP